MKGTVAALLAMLATIVVAITGCSTKVAGTAMPGADIPTMIDSPTSTSSMPIVPHHSVFYLVTADRDTQVTIIYLSTEPTVMPASKKPPFSDLTMTQAITVGPNKPWTFNYTLNDPDSWRYVHASITGEVRATLHCLVSVDEFGTDDVQQENSVSCPDRPSW